MSYENAFYIETPGSYRLFLDDTVPKGIARIYEDLVQQVQSLL
jgi:hypothetical protein